MHSDIHLCCCPLNNPAEWRQHISSIVTHVWFPWASARTAQLSVWTVGSPSTCPTACYRHTKLPVQVESGKDSWGESSLGGEQKPRLFPSQWSWLPWVRFSNMWRPHFLEAAELKEDHRTRDWLNIWVTDSWHVTLCFHPWLTRNNRNLGFKGRTLNHPVFLLEMWGFSLGRWMKTGNI